jgi:hypothetical protein
MLATCSADNGVTSCGRDGARYAVPPGVPVEATCWREGTVRQQGLCGVLDRCSDRASARQPSRSTTFGHARRYVSLASDPLRPDEARPGLHECAPIVRYDKVRTNLEHVVRSWRAAAAARTTRCVVPSGQAPRTSIPDRQRSLARTKPMRNALESAAFRTAALTRPRAQPHSRGERDLVDSSLFHGRALDAF